jgi:hypothetical protein
MISVFTTEENEQISAFHTELEKRVKERSKTAQVTGGLIDGPVQEYVFQIWEGKVLDCEFRVYKDGSTQAVTYVRVYR